MDIRVWVESLIKVAWLTRPDHIRRLAEEEQYEWLRDLARRLFNKEKSE